MSDLLMDKYYELCNTQNIPNMARYAFEWKVLADAAASAGRPASAEAWYERARYYGKQAGGEYLRLIDMPFSELIQVAESETE